MSADWRPVYGFPHYEVCVDGRVRSLHRGRAELKPAWDKRRKLWIVTLYEEEVRQTVALHIVIAEAFFGRRPKGKFTAFRDGDRNNVRLSNLEYRCAKAHHRELLRRNLKLDATSPVCKMNVAATAG